MADVIGLRAKWVLQETDGVLHVVHGGTVVVDGKRIVAVLEQGSAAIPVQVIELNEHLLMPGFLNTHTHCVSGPLFRGVLEDRNYASGGGSIIRDVMLPLGEIVSEICTEDDIKAIAALGQLEALLSGSTTIVDMPRANHDAFVLAARDIGIRAYVHPYLMSTRDEPWGIDMPSLAGSHPGLGTFMRWHDKFDEGADGRIRIGLGPHAPDTCAPSLLRSIVWARDEFAAPVTIHLAQSADEIEQITQRFTMSPVRYLHEVGLLEAGLVAAHCIDATDDDLDLMAAQDVTIAHCPLSYARIARMARYSRFRAHGVRTTVASDAHALDIVADLRLASINSKYATGSVAAANAHEMIRAATSIAADAIRRVDLGRIKVGARADLVGIRMDHAHLQPVFDPLKSLVWNGTGKDVDLVMVDGEVLIERGQFTRGDQASIIRNGSSALEKVWQMARERAVL